MQDSFIADLLNKQEARANELLELLSHELDILKTRELSVLEAKAAEKEKCLSDINEIDVAIKQYTSFEQLQADDNHAAQVDRILALFKQCKEQNEVNGQIISNSQVAINRFKGMLQKSISNNSLTYDDKGKTNIKARSIGIKA